MTASTPGTLTERWLQSVRNWITAWAVSLRAGLWRGCNSKLTVRLVFRSLIGARGPHARAAILARLRLGRIGAAAHWARGGGSTCARPYLAACSPEGKKIGRPALRRPSPTSTVFVNEDGNVVSDDTVGYDEPVGGGGREPRAVARGAVR